MTEKLTVEEIQEIKERTENATKGPWVVERGEFSGDNWIITVLGEDLEGVSHYITADGLKLTEMNGGVREDSEFIAHAREDIPKLLAEIERLREVLKFYAEQRNYVRDSEGISTIEIDDGHRAFVGLGVIG